MDSTEEHWVRVVEWAKGLRYECTSVNVGASRFNVSPWYIYMVVMPELQPMHQAERLIYLGGKRLREVPTKLGYTPAEKLFIDEPHPFA